MAGYGVPEAGGVKAGRVSDAQKHDHHEKVSPVSAGAPEVSSARAHTGRLHKHLEGWQAGALLLATALLGASLFLPHGTEPTLVPTPAYDARRSAETDALEQERTRLAVEEGLPHSIRVVGERFRRLGLALSGNGGNATEVGALLASEVRAELAAGRAEQLLRLRALQTEMFVRAVRAWQTSEPPSLELRELGGDFVTLAKSAWLGSDGRLVLTEPELRLLFRVRWGLLTGTHRLHPFGPDLNGFRQYYATLLEHPESSADVIDRAKRRLSYVDALGKLDPSYAASFARGTLLYQLGDFEGSARAFEAQLGQAPDGPFVALSRNHWLAARANAQ